MMDQHEEGLQEKMERGEVVNRNEDTRAYDIVFHALKKTPEKTLSPSFEERIIQLVIEKRLKEARRDNFWFGFGLFLIFIAFVVAISMTGFALNFGFLNAMADWKGLVELG
jgi:hypothetical protein